MIIRRLIAAVAVMAGTAIATGVASAPAQSAIVQQGTLEEGGGDVTLDFVFFSVTSPGLFRLDLRGLDTGDGTLPDPFLALFEDTGTLEPASFITFDDDGGQGRNSRIQGPSPILDYVAAIDNFNSLAGLNDGLIPFSECDEVGDCGGSYEFAINTLGGSFQVTRILEGNLDGSFTETVVPLPAALPLFATAALGLGLVRRRQRHADS